MGGNEKKRQELGEKELETGRQGGRNWEGRVKKLGGMGDRNWD